jgi:hypothetical protein
MHSSSGNERRRLIAEITAMSMDIALALAASNPSALRLRGLGVCYPEARVIPTPTLRRLHQALVEFGEEARAAEAKREARRRSRITA